MTWVRGRSKIQKEPLFYLFVKVGVKKPTEEETKPRDPRDFGGFLKMVSTTGSGSSLLTMNKKIYF